MSGIEQKEKQQIEKNKDWRSVSLPTSRTVSFADYGQPSITALSHSNPSIMKSEHSDSPSEEKSYPVTATTQETTKQPQDWLVGITGTLFMDVSTLFT